MLDIDLDWVISIGSTIPSRYILIEGDHCSALVAMFDSLFKAIL